MATVYFVTNKGTTGGDWVKAESNKAAKEFIAARDNVPLAILRASKSSNFPGYAVVDATATTPAELAAGVYAVGQKVWSNGDEWVIRTVPVMIEGGEFQLADQVDGPRRGVCLVTPRYKEAETKKKQAEYKAANAIKTPQVAW